MRKLMLVTVILAFPAMCFANGAAVEAFAAYYPNVCEDLMAANNDCSLCHGDGLNPYGADLAAAELDFGAIEGIDSDEDGRTNGQEINEDCTLPGDPNDVPNDSSSWTNLKALFR